MPGQSEDIDKGGTLRLGAYPCEIAKGTTMERCYGASSISERHRHRYEFNNDYRAVLEEKGLTISGTSPDGRLVETVELTDRPFYVGVQFHPEFKSRPNRPHPLFKGFIGAALDRSAAGVGGGPDKKAAGKTEDTEAGSIDKNAEPAGTIAGAIARETAR